MHLKMGLGLQKCFLCVINFPTFLVGGGILGLSIFFLVGDPIKTVLSMYVPANQSNILNMVTSFQSLSVVVYFGVALGSLLFVSGFLGCCGALMENKCMLIVYSMIVTLILLALVSAAIVVGAMKDKIFTVTKAFLKDNILSMYTGDPQTSVYTLIFDSLQVLFDCCGVTNATDYASLANWNRTMNINGTVYTLPYPPTCCKFNVTIPDVKNVPLISNCLVTYQYNDIYSNSHMGCFTKLINMMMPYMTIIIGVVGGLAALLVVVDACSCYIIKKKN